MPLLQSPHSCTRLRAHNAQPGTFSTSICSPFHAPHMASMAQTAACCVSGEANWSTTRRNPAVTSTLHLSAEPLATVLLRMTSMCPHHPHCICLLQPQQRCGASPHQATPIARPAAPVLLLQAPLSCTRLRSPQNELRATIGITAPAHYRPCRAFQWPTPLHAAQLHQVMIASIPRAAAGLPPRSRLSCGTL